ncbi:hypothetical protein PIB30_025154 [Stylosanthes scabra]|uniref:Uncharacterized protein n=1 Tax=Stylosanthes scabra TaxID=79078 RepID=A0ABU6Y8R6_9FABA|nr:hypothetical protein [Stylosanthes scabra]
MRVDSLKTSSSVINPGGRTDQNSTIAAVNDQVKSATHTPEKLRESELEHEQPHRQWIPATMAAVLSIPATSRIPAVAKTEGTVLKLTCK